MVELKADVSVVVIRPASCLICCYATPSLLSKPPPHERAAKIDRQDAPALYVFTSRQDRLVIKFSVLIG